MQHDPGRAARSGLGEERLKQPLPELPRAGLGHHEEVVQRGVGIEQQVPVTRFESPVRVALEA